MRGAFRRAKIPLRPHHDRGRWRHLRRRGERGNPSKIRAALEAGAPPGVVLMDAGSGADASLRSALAGLGLAYVAGVQPHTSVWTRANPSPVVRPWSGRGRPTSRIVRDSDHQPQSVEGLALSLPSPSSMMRLKGSARTKATAPTGVASLAADDFLI